MATTKKSSRAWVPATVTTLLAILLLIGCGLTREILDDQSISHLRDRTNAITVFFYDPMAPLGVPGIASDVPFGDAIARLGGGLVPVVILVFLFTWLAARSGSGFAVLLGAWLGTILGVGLGSLASFQIFLWQNDITDDALGLLQKLGQIQVGLYWGAIGGFVLGLVALLTWLIVRPRADQPSPQPESEPTPWPPPAPEELASYPPPPKHASPARDASDETARAPDPSSGDRPPSI
jgi:hypothetical protein